MPTIAPPDSEGVIENDPVAESIQERITCYARI